MDKVLNIISIDSQDFELAAVYPKMRYLQLSGETGPAILIPDSFRMTIRTSIRGSEMVKKTNVYVDIDKLRDIFRDIIRVINLHTNHLRF
jgi:hypothetical protein